MTKSIRQASWLVVVALLMIAGYGLSSKASTDSAVAAVTETDVQRSAPTADAEAADVFVPQATCAAIKCPPGQICINALECTPAGDCFHVGRCVSRP